LCSGDSEKEKKKNKKNYKKKIKKKKKKKKKPNDYQKVNKQHASIGAFNKQVKTQHQFRMNTTATETAGNRPHFPSG